MDTPLPLKTLVLFIACGTLAFIILFICAKRQITRFALKSSKGPHTSIGHDAPKSLRREMERRLQRVGEIKYEPRLMSDEKEASMQANADAETCHFFFRMKAVDSLALLDNELKSYSEHTRNRVGQNLRTFLLEMRHSGPLNNINIDTIEHFAEAVDHARHDPTEFGRTQYEEFMVLLNDLIEHIRNCKNIETVKHTEELVLKAEPILEKMADPHKFITSADKPAKGSSGENTPSVTYRPTLRGSGVGVVCMTPRSNSGSSQGDSGTSESRSDQSSCASSRSSGHFETSV